MRGNRHPPCPAHLAHQRWPAHLPAHPAGLAGALAGCCGLEVGRDGAAAARAQLMAFQDDFLETTMFGARGHIPQMLTVALVGGDGRPLGVSNSVVFWETQMASPPVPPPPHCLPLWANLKK
jgi:hypothetical protein